MPNPQTLTELLAERTEAINEWTRAELINFIEEHGLTPKPVTALTKEELVAIVCVYGGMFDLDPVVKELRRVKEDVARVRPRRRSTGAIAS